MLQQPDELSQKQGIPFGLLPQGVDQGLRRDNPGLGRQEGAHLRRSEPAQQDLVVQPFFRQLAQGPGQRVAPGKLRIAKGTHDEQMAAGQLLGEKL